MADGWLTVAYCGGVGLVAVLDLVAWQRYRPPGKLPKPRPPAGPPPLLQPTATPLRLTSAHQQLHRAIPASALPAIHKTAPYPPVQAMNCCKKLHIFG